MPEKRKGTKDEVWDGVAAHTAGGKTRSDLMVNKWGKVVFKSRHKAAKRTGAVNNLIPYKKKSSRRKSSRKKKSSPKKKSSRKKSAKSYLYR